MKYEYLGTFLKVIKRGSLLSAAKELKISVSTVSAHVNAVENFFGSKLVERSVDGVALTRAGELAFGKISGILREMEELKVAVSRQDVEPIRIAFGNVPGISIFPRAIEEFKKKNPSVKIHAKIKSEPECIELMSSGEVDMAMMCYEDEEIDLRKYNYALIGADSLVLAVKKTHPLAARSRIALKELKGIPLIGLSKRSGITKALNKALKAKGYNLDDLNFMTEVDSVSTQLNSVARGLGAAITSQIASRYISSAREIKTLDVADLKAERNIYFLYSKALVNPKAVELAQFLLKKGREILKAQI